MISSNSKAARFYGLPQIQSNLPMHPIVSACGTATCRNYCGKTPPFVKDSIDFIKKIKHLSINPEEETLVSFDVSVLFTSIPVPVALQVITFKISTYTSFTNVYKIPTKMHHASGIHYHQLHLLFQ